LCGYNLAKSTAHAKVLNATSNVGGLLLFIIGGKVIWATGFVMTGLWQVSGRNDVDYDTRVYFDSWYVKNWTLWNDIAILFKTA
ncbi:sugar transferase, partial [Salmonella enterica subsp. enterica serovar Kentucky]|nr:sugar transferase [Salmonella enterica subsp. enterica serovar Kentucky]